MKKEDLQFKIDQLRKDKMIYALESIALSALAFVAFFTLVSFPFGNSLVLLIFVIPFGYWIYMSVGNFNRLKEIKKLEKELRKFK
jgi:hypothetical protein